MSQLALNGNNTPIDSGFHTWQELLTDLESSKLSRNEVIASVQFDGDEVYEFRAADALSRQLDSIQEVRVEAVGKNEMLGGAVQEAEDYLASLRKSAVNVAELFRGQRLDQANPRLQELFEGIKLFIALLRGMELSMQGIPGSKGSAVERALEQMGTTLQDQIGAQAQQDWLLLADILEYDLAPHLDAFGEILSGFRQQLGLN